MNKVLFPAMKVCINPRTGVTIGNLPYSRPKTLKVEFPEIGMRELTGEIRHSPAWNNALVHNDEVQLSHSLVVSLNPSQAGSVAKMWRNLIVLSPELKERYLDAPVYFAQNEGSGTWGHWLVHNLPRVLFFLQSIPDGVVVLPVGYRMEKYSACLEILLKFGVPIDRIVFQERDEIIRAKATWIIDLPYMDGVPHPAVFQMYNGLRINRGRKVVSKSILFIRRATNRREVSNLEEIEPILAKKEAVVQTMSGALEEQIRAWSSSSVASGVLGSDLTNMVFGNTDRLFVISPQWFGDKFFFGIAAGMGIEWNELVCDESSLTERREPKHASSFRVSPEDLDAFLPDF